MRRRVERQPKHQVLELLNKTMAREVQRRGYPPLLVVHAREPHVFA